MSAPAVRFTEFNEPWRNTTLGNEAKFSKGRGVSKSDIVDGGTTPCIRYGQLYTDYGTVIDNVISTTNVDPATLRISMGGEVIVPASGEDAKDIATAAVVLRPGVALGGDLNIITTEHNGSFLASYLSGKKRPALAVLAQGNSVVHLYPRQLSGVELAIPSLPEQRRITDALSAVDAKIDLLGRKRDALARFKAGLMQKLFSQEVRFTRKDGSAYPDPKSCLISELGVIYGGLNGKSAQDFGTGLPFITYKQVFNQSAIDLSACSLVSVSPGERQNLVALGDVLFTSSSETPKEVGYASVVMDEPSETYLNSFCFGFRPKHGLINAQYSRYLFHAEQYRHQVEMLAQGSTRYNISKKGFAKILLSIPSLPEQRHIARALSAMGDKIDLLSQQRDTLINFKAGLLQQMFV